MNSCQKRWRNSNDSWTTIYYGFKNIIIKPYDNILFLRRKENSEKHKAEEIGYMIEEIFTEILDSSDGDYAVQALVLAKMKPSGW